MAKKDHSKHFVSEESAQIQNLSAANLKINNLEFTMLE